MIFFNQFLVFIYLINSNHFTELKLNYFISTRNFVNVFYEIETKATLLTAFLQQLFEAIDCIKNLFIFIFENKCFKSVLA